MLTMREPGTVKTSMLYNRQPIKKCNTHVITDIKHGLIVFIKKYNNNKHAHKRQECTVNVVTMLLGWIFEELRLIFVNNQCDAQFLFMYVYFCSLHVSGSHVLIIRRINRIDTTSGICHSV